MIKRLVCSNPWCKAQFDVEVSENQELLPTECHKCKSFNTELGSVTWTEKNMKDLDLMVNHIQSPLIFKKLLTLNVQNGKRHFFDIDNLIRSR
jgi:hypothetical protein